MGEHGAATGAHPRSGVAHRPRLDATDAAHLLSDGWGITGTLTPLDSERDQNWAVTIAGLPRYVLKIANETEVAGSVDLQQQMMARLAAAGVPCPRPVRTLHEDTVRSTGPNLAWLISFLPGTVLARVRQPSDALWRDLGRTLGRAATALRGFDHPAAHRHLQWDAAHAESVITANRTYLTDPARTALIDAVLERYQHNVRPVWDELPSAVIHNDANDYNVLVDGDAVTGLIDFADAVHTVAVNDVAVACAYAMLDRDSPWDVAGAITAGVEEIRPLTADEHTVLPHLIATRLATSVCISAYQQTLAPDDEYLRISEAPAWALLARLAEDTQ